MPAEPRRRRILCGAESFGFGPCAKLLAIAPGLRERGCSLHFAGEGTALQLARGSARLFDEVLAVAGPGEVADRGYDAVLSVMEAGLAAWGHDRGLPVVMVDSLYRIWRWPFAERAAVAAWVAGTRGRRRLPALLARLDGLPRHMRFYAAHAMAEVSLVQRWGPRLRVDLARGAPGAGADEAADDPAHRLRPVDPIVDLGWRAPAARDTVLVSLGGMRSVLVPPSQRSTWIALVGTMVRPALDAAEGVTVVVAAPDEHRGDVTAALGRAPRALAHDELLALLNRAAAVFAPPGLTTLLECGAYGAPLLLLPELHGGHFHNAASLVETVGPAAFPGTYPNALLHRRLGWRDPLRDVGAQQAALLAGERPEVVADAQQALAAALRSILGGGAGPDLAARQRAALVRHAGGFDGAQACVEAVAGCLVASPGRA